MMKVFFKASPIILAILLLPFQCKNNVTIPDEKFLNALIEIEVDQNEDGKISSREAKDARYLNLSNKRISDMTGIEAFLNLRTLGCSSNQLTNLDVSNNPSLGNLSCASNQITDLDLTNNPELEHLDCSYNLITNIDLSNCPILRSFRCNMNRLTSLDISNNTTIVELYLRDMPFLEEVCVWEMPFPPFYMILYTDGSYLISFTTECSN